MDRSVGDRDARVGELLDAYLAAARDGRPLERESFIAAHPDVAVELRAALAGFDFVRRAGDALAAPAAQRDDVLATGTLGDFRLVREVGRGGMGVVYEAEQISLGRKVALKVLPFAAVLDDRQLQRFRHEAQAAALLHHTNIVPVYSVGTERGVHYYAMQFVEGRTLADVIGELRTTARGREPDSSAGRARGRRPSRRAGAEAPADPPSSAEALALTPNGTTETPDYCRAIARIGLQAAEALEHAHENGVVHRDVKPANLMLDARGHLWVADFGLARSVAAPNLTATGTMLGTLRYMSPEQARTGRAPIDHRTDVWSLGVTLIEALTLEPAFPGDDPNAVIQDIASRDPARPDQLNRAVPAALGTILLKAVAKDPESRYATAREMADDLKRYLDDKPVLARRAPLVDRAALWARRHRAAVVAAAAVLAVAVVALSVSAVNIAASKRRAEDALADSRRDAARAEANFAKALEAVDRLLTRVGTDALAGVPGFEQTRRKLLTDAVAFYQEFLDEAGDDRRVRYAAARATLRLGELHSLLGDAPAALAAFERARSMLVQIAPLDGPWSPVFDDIVHVEVRRAGALGSVAIYEAAVALAGRNVKERPSDARLANRLSMAQQEFGRFLATLGRHEEARTALLAAVERQKALAAREPNDQALRENLADTLSSLTTLAALSEPEEAERLAREGLTYCDAAESSPADSNVYGRRAWLLRKLGDALLDSGKLDEAERVLRNAFEARARQETEFPHVPGYSLDAADCLGRLAYARHRLGRAKDAEAAYADTRARFARILDRHSGAPGLRAACAFRMQIVAHALAESGRHEEAEAIFRDAADVLRAVVHAEPGIATHRYELARTLANMCGCLGRADRIENDELLRLLAEAREAIERSLEPSPSVPEYRDTLAWILGMQAVGLETAGDAEAAIAARRRCADIKRELTTTFARGTRPRIDLADTLGHLGTHLREAERLAESEAVLREARSILDALPQAPARDPYVADIRVTVLDSMAWTEEALGRHAEAEKLLRQSLALCEELTSPSLTTPDRRHSLGVGLQLLAIFLRDAKRPAEAEPLFERAIDVFTGIAVEDPTDVRDRERAATCCRDLAGILRDANRTDEAIVRYRKSAAFALEVAEILPERGKRSKAHNQRQQLALYLRECGRWEEARREHQGLAELCGRWATDAPDDFYRRNRVSQLFNAATTWVAAGETRSAIAELERVLAQEPGHVNSLQVLAELLSDGPDPAVRDTRKAVELARAALDAGADKAGATCFLAQTLTSDGRWSDGLAAYAAAQELGYQSDGSDWIYEALAHAKLGDMEQARELYDRAVPSIREAKRDGEENLARRTAEVAGLLGPPAAR